MFDYKWWYTIPEIVENMRVPLESGDTIHALRLMMDGLNYLRDARDNGQLAECLGEPVSLGSVRWDTLVAASLRYVLHQMGEEAPAWTRKQPLDVFWWPTSTWSQQQYIDMAHSPVELSNMGIFMDERDFTTV